MAGKDTEYSDAIIVKNVCKKFVIPHERRTTLFEGIGGAFRPNIYEKFTALENISFTVKRGESIGIIGDNGCGKSTLLKIISGILRPSSGSVEVHGKITPFLELGVGFQPDLSSKENIEVYSTVMGLSSKEIARNMDSVLEFAGLTKFRDTKLKNLSSGMQVRLAFSTAIQAKPEILLVDEILAVGDMDFQQKCLDIFSDYRKSGVTIVFVSHDLNSIRRFCDKALYLKNGEMLAFGNTGEIIDRYVYGIDKPDAVPAQLPEAQATVAPAAVVQDGGSEKNDRWGNQKITIKKVNFYDKFGNENDRINSGDTLIIYITYYSNEPVDDPVFGIAIYNDMDFLCYGTNTDIEGMRLGTVSGDGIIKIKIPTVSFTSGKFLFTVAAHSKDHIPYDWIDKKYSFTVINTGQVAGLFNLQSEWEYQPIK